MKKILFPTDFSEESPQLLNYSLTLAKQFNTTLVVIHVYGSPAEELNAQKDSEEMEGYMMDVLMDFVKKNKGEGFEEVEIEYIVDIGFPWEEIVEVALDENIELIVMGMTGSKKASGNLFGSTAQSVIGKADCPVLAIPFGFNYEIPKHIGYMTNFVFRDIGVINFLKHWAKAMDAQVHCLHVVEKNAHSLDEDINMKILKDAFKNHQITNFEVLEGDLIEASNQYFQERNIGLVAFLSHKRSFFQWIFEGSKTREVAERIEIPILVFKENAYKPVVFPVDFTKISIA